MKAERPVEIGLGFGSNEGDRMAHLRTAKERVLAIPGIRFIAQSSLYETEPVGVKPEYQHLKFINAVMVVLSEIPLADLHRRLLEIEAEIGRRRTGDRFAPRPLDIDILYAGSLVVDSPSLKLPHPQCLKRRFVLEPLSEIVPDLVLPNTNLTTKDLLAGMASHEQVFKLPAAW